MGPGADSRCVCMMGWGVGEWEGRTGKWVPCRHLSAHPGRNPGRKDSGNSGPGNAPPHWTGLVSAKTWGAGGGEASWGRQLRR
jgi:hypothetical protein